MVNQDFSMLYTVSANINGNLVFISGTGGDPKLFSSRSDAYKGISVRDDFLSRKCKVKPYIPNIVGLDAIEHLRDKGFGFFIENGCLYVSCDAVWNTPCADIVKEYLGNNKLYSNNCYMFGIGFSNVRYKRRGWDDHYMVFDIDLCPDCLRPDNLISYSDWIKMSLGE